MKTRICPFLTLCLLLAVPLPAQDRLPPDQLDSLLGPIALYPDALVALILPAATSPTDVAQAARYLRTGGDPGRTDDQPWDDSVRALAHYPDVVEWMDQNMGWTEQVGYAFDDQSADVMNSIQHLRREARAAGTLIDSPQQQVILDNDEISIVPAQPEVIYVPYYDPAVVYMSHPGFSPDSYLSFGIGYDTGFWLAYDLDWRQRRIWTLDPSYRQRYWRDHHDSRQPVFTGRAGDNGDSNRRPWKPRATAPRPQPPVNRSRPEIARPTPFPNAPPRATTSRQNPPDRGPANRDQPATDSRRPGNPPAPGPAAASRVNPSDRPPDNHNQPNTRDARDDRRPTEVNAKATVTPPPAHAQPLPPPETRPAPPPTRPPTLPPARDDKNNKDERQRPEPEVKPAVTPPPARTPPLAPPRDVRPPGPVRPPVQDDKNAKESDDDKQRRQPSDKPAVAPPQPSVHPQPPVPPPHQVRPVPAPRPPASDDKDDKDSKDDKRRSEPENDKRNKD